MPDDLRVYEQYVDRIPSVAEHEAAQRKADYFYEQLTSEIDARQKAEQEYEALASLLMRIVWLAVGALVLLGVVAWAAALIIGG